MTAIVKTRQQRQARLMKSLETTPSLTPFYWPDDFINHQPSDEFVCVGRDISVKYIDCTLIIFLILIEILSTILLSSTRI